jgi:hypothetical protein
MKILKLKPSCAVLPLLRKASLRGQCNTSKKKELMF